MKFVHRTFVTMIFGLIIFVLKAFVPMVIVIIALSQIHSTGWKLFKCTKDINNCSRVVVKRYKRRKIGGEGERKGDKREREKKR